MCFQIQTMGVKFRGHQAVSLSLLKLVHNTFLFTSSIFKMLSIKKFFQKGEGGRRDKLEEYGINRYTTLYIK